jgi:hypothetical protein
VQDQQQRQGELDQIANLQAAAFDGAPAVAGAVDFEILQPIVRADELVGTEEKSLLFYPRNKERLLSVELYAVDPLWRQRIFIGSAQVRRNGNAPSISGKLWVDSQGRVHCSAEGQPVEIVFDNTTAQNQQQQVLWQRLDVRAVQLLELAHRCSPVASAEAESEAQEPVPLPVLMAPARAAAAAAAAAAAVKRQQQQQNQQQKQAKRARQL